MPLIILGIILIFGWTGLFLLISWLLKHAFDILDIIIWVVIGYASLFVLVIIGTILYHLILELFSFIRKKQISKIKEKIENEK